MATMTSSRTHHYKKSPDTTFRVIIRDILYKGQPHLVTMRSDIEISHQPISFSDELYNLINLMMSGDF